MILPAILTLMAFIAVMALALPLMRPRAPGPSRAAYERAVLADQMAEIERDLERGVIDATQAEAARAEIGRRALARLEGTGTAAAPFAPPRRRWATAAAVLLPIAAGAIYVALGRPDLPGRPFAARPQPAAPATAEAPSAETLAAVADIIAARVREAPADVEGWRLLIRLSDRIGQKDAAQRLYRDVLGKSQDPARRAAIAVAYGEAAMLANDGALTAAARDAFATALAADPADPQARYYRGLVQLQAGDPGGAYRTWTALRDDAPADVPWRARLDEDIARLKRDHGVGP